MFYKDSIIATVHEPLFEISVISFKTWVLSWTCMGCYITRILIKKINRLDRGSDISAFVFVTLNMCFPQLSHCFVERKSCLSLIIKFNSCWKPHGSSLSVPCVSCRRKQPRQAVTFPALSLFSVRQIETRKKWYRCLSVYVSCSTYIHMVS